MRPALPTLVVALLAAAPVAWADQPPDAQSVVDQFCAKAQTTADMNECAGKMLASADRDLNATYQAVLKKWVNVPRVVDAVRRAQRGWIAYRDTDLAARFADSVDPATRGTAYPSAHAMYQADLTRERTARLCQFLRGASVGESNDAPCADLVRHPSIVPAPSGH